MEPVPDVFVCGPRLRGDSLTKLTVRHGAVVWEPDADGELPPDPVEPIRETHSVVIGGVLRLTLLVTSCGIYLTDQTIVLQPAATEGVVESHTSQLLGLGQPT